MQKRVAPDSRAVFAAPSTSSTASDFSTETGVS
jgi:hypothetical protein